MFTIYKVSNAENEKLYIGLTATSLSKRMVCHNCEAKRGNHRKLYVAMREIGLNKFRIEALATTDDEATGFLLETSYVAKFDSYRNGYNETPTGGVGGTLFA